MTADSNTLAGAFSHFASTAEQVAATRKRNEKAAILGSYFAGLDDDDLVLAVRFFAGHIFPLWDQRTTNVGGSALLNAIASVSQARRDDLTGRLVVLGDLGDLAYEFFASSKDIAGIAASLTLRSIATAFDQFAATGGSRLKTEMLAGLLGLATPLEARYLVKLLAGDLRIGLKEGSVEDAIAKLRGVRVADVQWVNMLTGDIGETALLARHNRLTEARMRLFHPIRFMLATPASDLDDVAKQMPEEFFVEDKFDGIRAQAHLAPGGRKTVTLFSRTLDDITGTFPDLVAPLGEVLASNPDSSSGLVFDGEIVPVRDNQILPFLDLQKRLGRKTLPDALLKQVPVAYVVFDVLYAEGRVLIKEPLSVRRAVLESLALPDPRVRRTETRRFRGISAIDGEFTASRGRGNEGLMVKSPESPYKPGRRGRDWLKIKRALATLDVVVTAVETGNGRRSHLLSDYTFAVRASETDPTLLNVGKAYSGLTDAELSELSGWFKRHTIKEFAQGRVRIVEPRIVLEVTFDLVQASKRHKSGYALRFPRILRLRPDKPAEEIDTLKTVERLAAPKLNGPAPPKSE